MHDLKHLQRQMSNYGFYTGDIDGLDGPKTQEALRKFQQLKDLNDERYVFSGITWNPTKNYTLKKTIPGLIVIHYTACPAYVAISGFKRHTDKNGKAYPNRRSAHYVIETTGNVTQMVTDTNKAWHAGDSSWKGRKDCNSYSIGIELENFGPLAALKGKTYTWNGDEYNGPVDEINGKLWQSYDWVQIEACAALVAALKRRHQITDVTGHEFVSPGRKQDPGPAFPWEEFNKTVAGYEQKMEEDIQ